MRVKKENAIKLFQALGFKTASNWSSKMLITKLNNLSDLVEEGFELEDKKMNIRLGKVLKAVKNGKRIRVVNKYDNENEPEIYDNENEPEIEEREKPMAEKKSKKEKVAKKAEVKSKEKVNKKKETKEKKPIKAKAASAWVIDEFGSRLGTIKAKINAVLSKTPKTMKQILKESKVVNSQTGHLLDLIKAGLVEKDEKGYKIK